MSPTKPDDTVRFTDLFRPTGLVLVRTPRLPFEELLAWEPPAADASAPRAESPEERRRLVKRWMLQLVGRPAVREALALASPSLAQALPAWAEMEDGPAARKLDRSVFRYLVRMCSRPTPFGLFAGISLGEVGDKTVLSLGPGDGARRHTRLDWGVICRCILVLLADRSMRQRLKFVPNATIFPSRGRLFFYAMRYSDAEEPLTVGLKPSPSILAVIEAARGSAGIDELAAAARRASAKLSEQGALKLVNQLVDAGLLIPTALPPLPGPEPLDSLLAELGSDPVFAPVTEPLTRVRAELAALSHEAPDAAVERCRTIMAVVQAPPLSAKMKDVLHVDMVRPAEEISLGPEPIAELQRVAELVYRMSPANDTLLGEFCQRFSARYENRAVPLLEVIDVETGVGFGGRRQPLDMPLLDGVPGTPRDEAKPWSPLDRFRQKLLTRALTEGKREVELRSDELPGSGRLTDIPVSYTVLATIAARSSEAVSRGEFSLLRPQVISPSGIFMAGRFAHADARLERFIRDHVRREEELSAGTIVADVSYASSPHQTSVLLRPPMRSYEIVCHGRSSLPPERQIPLTDLLVSVVGRQVLLHSIRLGKRVIPRKLEALNGLGGQTPEYHFLHWVSGQEERLMSEWRWGLVGDDAPFLPRVRFGRTILAGARWNLDAAAVERLVSAKSPQRVVDELRAKLDLPRWVMMKGPRQWEPFDLENPMSCEDLASFAQGASSLLLEELMFDEGRLTRDANGSYVSEVLVPFARNEAPAPAWATTPPLPFEPGARKRVPGSDVLYLKVYVGVMASTRVLLDALAPLARRAVHGGLASSWHFMRHVDPDPHLRLRLFGGEKLWSVVLPELRQALGPYIEDGTVKSVQVDTYEREIERFGGLRGIELTERVFHVDSEASADALAALVGAPGDAVWQAVALSVDGLLHDFGLSTEQRLALLERHVLRFFGEIDQGPAYHKALNDKYRQHRALLTSLVAAEEGARLEAPLDEVHSAIRRRGQALAPIIADFREAEALGQLSVPVDALLPSFIHFFAHRTFETMPRPLECALLHLLVRAYRAKLSRPS